MQDIWLKPGRYVLAVSGGVDSMVLLDLLSRQKDLELVVAHFDHGIREDSAKDEKLVKRTANRLKLEYVSALGRLGSNASEERARNARYAFLNGVKDKYHAKAIVTAHHQDDLIETAAINLLRGTGRLGLGSMLNNQEILRPLIKIPKEDILNYAKSHRVAWREDNSNNDTKYLRNYMRLKVLPKLTDEQKQELLINAENVANNQQEADDLIATLSRTISSNDEISRSKYLAVPSPLDKELVVFWLRQSGANDFDRRAVERVSLGIKTGKPGTSIDVIDGTRLVISAHGAHFSNR